MSLRFRDANGAETVLAGLTPGGNLEAGAVAVRKGILTLSGSTSGGWWSGSATFSSPMPDTDYVVVFEPTSTVQVNLELIQISNKTVNGFSAQSINPQSAGVSSWDINFTAWKIYDVADAEQLYSEIQNLEAMIPSTASSTNQFATKDDVRSVNRALNMRISDIEDVIPLDATVSNQLATDDDVNTVAADAATRLKVVDIIPSTPADKDVILYTGTETGFRKGGIYQYAATPGAWVLISTADVDLSHYETSFTGTTAEWNALSSTEQNKYDLVSLTDDNERDNGDNYSTNEQRVGTWIDGKPLYRISFTLSNPATSTAPSSHAEITVTKSVSSLHIDKIVKWDAIVSWPPSSGSNVEGYYFPTDITTTGDITSSVSGSSAVGSPNNYTRQYFYKNGNYIGLAKNGRYYGYGVTAYNTIYYTKTTD